MGTTPRAASAVQGDLARQGVAAAAPWAWGIRGHVCWCGHSRRDSEDPTDVTEFHFCVKCHKEPLGDLCCVVFFFLLGTVKQMLKCPSELVKSHVCL